MRRRRPKRLGLSDRAATRVTSTSATGPRTRTWSLLPHRRSGRAPGSDRSGLTGRQRDAAVDQTAVALASLHAWRPPAAIARLLSPPAPSDDPNEIVGASLLPLPLDRARHLLEPARANAPTYGPLIDRAVDWLEANADLLPRLDDPGDSVIHGDLHLSNIWWDGTRVEALLDLEWTRFAPAWLDLATVRDNALAGDAGERPHAQLLAGLRRLVPGLDPADLIPRLTAVQLVFQIRQLAIWPRPGPDPAVDHPVRVLERLLDRV